MRLALPILVALAAAQSADADDFCADRPGLATGTCVVPAGQFQIESSLAERSIEREGGVRSTSLSFGPTTLRLGVLPGVELQASAEPLVRSTSDGVHGWSAGDVAVGLKALLSDPAAPVHVALYPTLIRPAGRRQLEAALLVPVSFDLSASWGLTLTPEADLANDQDGGGRHPSVALAASLGRDLGQRWSAALDVQAARDFDPGGTSRSLAAGLSLAWLARRNLQLDIEADKGIAGAAPDLSLAAGFAWRP